MHEVAPPPAAAGLSHPNERSLSAATRPPSRSGLIEIELGDGRGSRWQRRQSGSAAARADGIARVIPVPSGVRVWLATGTLRRGMNSLALQVQQALARDPHAGDLYVFRGRRADLLKILWHDSLGMSLYAKRLERGRFIWPSPTDGVVGR